ncbi:NmrA family protein [Leadbetterella byssophila DSM 17132]|uniref:NmrA family protein n=1 Tax=Leadbetterella byssophila (strain DSM 17132 / JCM 16389 / KACC 11308 / NBRC 106382 / 4M15) TaxID=649349 RepID=E4RSS3_LEAB4|nr:NAD(P)H-binding protein [Leadbetterella byssophila]ADQ15923.1 NmrA family protein [Leadbetterella byssophila DSM 17132]
MKKIAIIGATGMLGQPVTKEFINAGFDVTLLVRDINKAKQIFGSTVRLVEGDLKDSNKLRQSLDGQDGLYLNLSVEQKSGKTDFQPERDGLDNILEAAKNSTVKRIGYLSSLVHLYQGQNGFDWWAFDIKQKAVTKIKNSGLTYSIFYPSTFMESFDKGAYRQGNNIVLAGTSKHKMFLISGSDYGKQVVKAFQLDNGNHDYVVQGQDGYTADEAAKFYVDNYTKKKVKIMKAPVGLLKFFGKFTNKFNYGANIIEALNNYPEKFEAEKTWQDLGKPQVKFIDYIKKN